MIDDGLVIGCYFGERLRVEGRLFSDVLCELFEEHDVATSVLLRATGGFGLGHHLRGDQSLTMSEDPSVLALAVDERERMEPLLARLARRQPRGMLTAERTRIVAGSAVPTSLPEPLHEATKLTVHVGRRERAGSVPAYVAVCALLHRHGIAGATALAGVDGTRRRQRVRARFFDHNRDVPALVVAVGAGDRILAALPELEQLLPDPVLTVERVRVCKRDGVLLAAPHELPDADEAGLGVWQKLTVYSSEANLHEGEPVHRALVRRLRAGDAHGATALRGVWGYHGDHAPHGDRLWQLGRRVPVVTVLVDAPSRIRRSFDLVDEVTGEHGLVTSEMVPAMRYAGSEAGGLRLADHEF